MKLKPTFLKIDFRHEQLVLVFVPFLIWVIAVTISVVFFRDGWGIPLGVLLFLAGGLFATKLPSLSYALASRSLVVPLNGLPGKDFLHFHSEPPETFNKLKIIPEDSGYIFVENGCYRIVTLKCDYSIPFTSFHHEPIKKKSVAKGLLLRFQPNGSSAPLEFAASFVYYGIDLNVAANIERKCEWASKVIEAMKG